MSELIALRAMFGQDEVSHGMTRYCVAVDHSVHVPREVALYLVNSGGFAVESRDQGWRSWPRSSRFKFGQG